MFFSLSLCMQEENLSHVKRGDFVAGIHKLEVCSSSNCI